MKIIFEHYRIPDGIPAPKKGPPNLDNLFRYSREYGFNGLDYYTNSIVSPVERPPQQRGGITICRIVDDDNFTVGVGAAMCSMSDQFCYKTGRELAEQRARDEMAQAARGIAP